MQDKSGFKGSVEHTIRYSENFKDIPMTEAEQTRSEVAGDEF